MDFGSHRDSILLLQEKKSGNWVSWICLSPFTKYVLPSFGFALLIVAAVYFGMLAWFPQDDSKSQSTCHLQASYYVPCLPGKSIITLNMCLDLGCCWRDDLNLCYHAFPSRYGYKVDSFNDGANKDGTLTALRKYSPAGQTMRNQLAFRVNHVNDHHVRISLTTSSKINYKRDNAANRSMYANKEEHFYKLTDFGHLFDFLPPNDEVKITKFTSGINSSIKVLLHQPEFAITLMRLGEEGETTPGTVNGRVLLSTARGPLIVTNDYWEWTLYLTSGTLYGLNNIELNGTSNWIYNNEHETIRPAFLAIDPSGNAVSCFINYIGPLEVQVLNESNLVILRGLFVPEELRIELFTGPSPVEATKQLAGAVFETDRSHAANTHLSGLHLCPDAQESITLSEALENLQNTIIKMKNSRAPWDSHCLTRRVGFTLEHGLNKSQLDLVAKTRQVLSKEGRRFAAHLTPVLAKKGGDGLRGILGKESCLLRNRSSDYTGRYDGANVIYPDWTKKKTGELARDALNKYHAELLPDFVILRDSWPKDETTHTIPDNEFDYLPEGLRKAMLSRTVPFDVGGEHYAVHNGYATEFAKFAGVRSAIVELRGHESNSADTEPSWRALRRILRAGISAAVTGQIPSATYLCGADITRQSLDNELCIRWYGLAVTWPRILVCPEKSPSGNLLSSEGAIQAAKLLRLRAALATYQHTVLASFARDGLPIFSVLTMLYPNETQPRNTTNTQFIWGDSVLAGLVISPKTSQVIMWLPGEFPWRLFPGGTLVNPTGNGSVSVTAPIGQIVTLLRPGRIIPVHLDIAESTRKTMLSGITLLANPACSEESCEAHGRIHYGDVGGEQLVIWLRNSTLTFGNVAKVREVAGCAASDRTQATLFESLELLGDTIYVVDQDLCNVKNDTLDIDLSVTSDRPSFVID